MYTPFVSVIIPTYNRDEELIELIYSLLESDYKNIEVIVVDDASPSGIPEEIKSIRTVKVIRNKKEKLLAGSRNVGIENARGELCFLVDSDNVVARNTISELVKAIHSNPLLGVVCPLTYYLEDPLRIWWAGTIRSKITSLTRSIGQDQLDLNQFKTLIESESFRNAFMVRTKLIQNLGLFDEKYFPIHYDEADLSERIKREGVKIVVVPTAKIWHNIPRKTKYRSLHIPSKLRAYYGIRSRVLFHKKWSSNLLELIVALSSISLITVYYAVMALFYAPQPQKYDIFKSTLQGFIDGLRTHIASLLQDKID
ncbi:hypothetical protein ES702_05368 [subsurface metagenome]